MAVCGKWQMRVAERFGSALVALCAIMILASCIPDPVVAVFEPGDLRPPAVISWGATGPDQLIIVFDEAVSADMAAFAVSRRPTEAEALDVKPLDGLATLSDSGQPAVVSVSPEKGSPAAEAVVIALDGGQEPGVGYILTGLVSDGAGNLSSFVLPYWGFNDDPAGLVINELLTEGTSTHPDALEFFVGRGGNLAGLTVFIGSPALHELRYVFPACVVSPGEYVILHLKPQGLPEEMDELGGVAVSGGLDASSLARDFWVPGEPGSLPGKNGAITLCLSPTAGIMDAVAYSERTAESDSKYAGFGSAAFRDRVAELVSCGAWTIGGSSPSPADCARSTGTTSTRTLCRSSQSSDSDSAADWHIVPTRGISLGTANSDEVYMP